MTLRELWMIIVKNWKLMVVLPVVFALAGAGYILVTQGQTQITYNARARIIVNSQLAAVNGIAASDARSYTNSYDKDDPTAPKISVSSDGGSMTVTVSSTTVDEETCIELVNAIAVKANEVAVDRFADFENPYNGQVEEATESTEQVPSTDYKNIPIALLAGLFLALCIVVIIDIKKRPVKTLEGVQEAVELPVLEIIPAANGERLLANMRFATKKRDLKSILVVPAGDKEAAQATCELLRSAAATEGAGDFAVECAAPLSEGISAAYASQEADAVVVVARQWADKMPDLESTVAELKLAGATVAGVAFCKERLA